MAFYTTFKVSVALKLLLCYYCLEVMGASVVVESPIGKIRGEVVKGDSSDQSYVAFRNIPYAKPPVGELRFAKTQPHPKFDGVFDGTDNRLHICIHPKDMLYGFEQGSEDCLILNIFAKSIEPSEKLKKVMVFIHGGAFVLGTGSFYNMNSFVTTHDVIGVTINYRLGILGFLSTGNEAAPGNYGLWDQAMAIKWVKENIKAFGGDPDDITISGESAGGASVAYQSISPVTKGLFSKACPQSSAATSAYGRAIDVQKHALTVAAHSKCWEGEITDALNLKQSEVLINCLRSLDESSFSSFTVFSLSEPQFVPTVDGDFLPGKPLQLLQDESYLESIGFYDRSYLISLVNNEMAIMKAFHENSQEMMQGNNEEKKNAILKLANDIMEFYMKSRLDIDAINSSIVEDIMDFYTRRKVGSDALLEMVADLSFLIPSYDFLNAVSKQKKCKSWFLYFNHFPAFMKGNHKGSAHGVDLLYWLDIQIDDLNKVLNAGMEGEMDDGDLRLKSMYSAVIAGFMKNGDPGASIEDLPPSGWPTYDPHNSNYLDFNLEPIVRSHLEREKRNLWLKTIPKWMKKNHVHTEL